jgi:hypothetical protein
MAKEIKLMNLAGLRLSAALSAIAGSLLLWAALIALAFLLLDLPLGEAILAGLLATLLHWLSELWHQLGHAWAARRTGYPMSGVRLWGVLSTSYYPRDEPELPGAVHRRRALGGPVASITLGIVGGLVALGLRSSGGLPWWLAAFAALENLLVFGLGAFLPLGFTDGSTLLEWRGK